MNWIARSKSGSATPSLDAKTTGVRPNSSNIERDSDGLLDRRVRPICSIEKKRLGREKRWLREKPRVGAVMLLSCMHQERVA